MYNCTIKDQLCIAYIIYYHSEYSGVIGCEDVIT